MKMAKKDYEKPELLVWQCNGTDIFTVSLESHDNDGDDKEWTNLNLI